MRPGSGGSGAIDKDFADVAAELGSLLGTWVAPRPAGPVRGGSINDAYRWECGAGTLFVKVAAAAAAPMFEAEATGLCELTGANAVRVPGVLARGATARHAFLALEWIDLSPLAVTSRRLLGVRLAKQHRHTAAQFGWSRDNTIGITPQVNTRTASWAEFFIERRLRFQFDLALRNGHDRRLQARGAELIARVPAMLTHDPAPSLLHGDLWIGNAAADRGGTPVIFDPAVYYGDREADLAMTQLFGGFGSEFHAAYEAAWPLPQGAARRANLYNLYHVLNHLNLFGTGYLGQAMSLMDSLLADRDG